MLNKLVEIIMIFAIYSFVGWFFEVVIDTIRIKKYINAGFLNGPFCPIYGFGILMILYVLTPVKDSLLLFFICSVILATVFEFIVGYILEKAFNQKWWDYSEYKLNIKGYVWAPASVGWGILCVILVYALQPGLDKLLDYLPDLLLAIIAFSFAIYMIIDLIVTLVALLKFKKKIVLLTEIGDRMEQISDILGKSIHDETMEVVEKGEEYSDDISALKIKYENILNKKIFGSKRIFRTFPKLNITDLIDNQKNKSKK